MNAPLLICNVSELPRSALAEFANACRQRLDDGQRLLTLFGRRAEDGSGAIVVTAVFLPPGGSLCALRASAQAGEHYPALTAVHPSAQIYERELWEQTGLSPDGHPWLKPVRFEGERQQRMADYPFFQVRGQEVHEVGVGPIHAGVIEPGHFRFMCHGETVHHRGLGEIDELSCKRRTIRRTSFHTINLFLIRFFLFHTNHSYCYRQTSISRIETTSLPFMT